MNILKSLNILLVEDELDIQKYYKEVFEYYFNIVYTATNGEEALEIYENQNISIIFTDYLMPTMNGYDLIVEIRKKDKNIPITVISNYDDREKLQKCIPLNLSGYLFKPLDYKDVKEYLKNLEDEVLENGVFEHYISNDCRFNLAKNMLIVQDNEYTLTNLELKFMILMISNKNRVVNYDDIIEQLYSFELTINKIKNLVYRLKSKYQFTYVKNINNIGYILVCDEK